MTDNLQLSVIYFYNHTSKAIFLNNFPIYAKSTCQMAGAFLDLQVVKVLWISYFFSTSFNGAETLASTFSPLAAFTATSTPC